MDNVENNQINIIHFPNEKTVLPSLSIIKKGYNFDYKDFGLYFQKVEKNLEKLGKKYQTFNKLCNIFNGFTKDNKVYLTIHQFRFQRKNNEMITFQYWNPNSCDQIMALCDNNMNILDIIKYDSYRYLYADRAIYKSDDIYCFREGIIPKDDDNDYSTITFNEMLQIYKFEDIEPNPIDKYVVMQIDFILESIQEDIDHCLNNPSQGIRDFYSCKNPMIKMFDEFVSKTKQTIRMIYGENVKITVEQNDTEFWFRMSMENMHQNDKLIEIQIEFIIDTLEKEIQNNLDNPELGIKTFKSCKYYQVFDKFVTKTKEEIIKKFGEHVIVELKQDDLEYWFEMSM